MATRGRKRLGEQPSTSKERKARFDERMRNADGARPGAPRRKPCVVYLSDESREVLLRNRALSRIAGSAAETDSEFLERLLLNGDLAAHTPVAAALRSTEDYIHVLLKAKAKLTKRVDQLKTQQEDAENSISDPDDDRSWDAVAAELCLRHDAQQWHHLFRLAERLRTKPIHTTTIEELTRQLHVEIREYLLDLCVP